MAVIGETSLKTRRESTRVYAAKYISFKMSTFIARSPAKKKLNKISHQCIKKEK